MGRRDGPISGWTLGAFAIIAIFILLPVLRWESFPIYLDFCYHACTMNGFGQAGGVSLYDFWEYAPVGRPNLYPPLLPVAMLALHKLGISTLPVMRLISVAIFPLLLAAIWLLAITIYSDREAFFVVLAATIPFTFFIAVTSAVPASLGLILLLLIFYALEKGKTLAAALLLGMSFYAHPSLPWLTLLAMIIYGIFNRDKVKPIFFAVLYGILLGGPWLIHVINHRGSLSFVDTRQNRSYEVNALLYIFAAAGLILAAKRKGRYLFPLVLLAAMSPMLLNYRYRFLCGQGLLGVIFLAGSGIDAFYAGVSALLKERVRPIYMTALPALIVYLLTLFSPSARRDVKTISFDISGSTFMNLLSPRRAYGRFEEVQLYKKKFIDGLIGAVERETAPDEIIYCNYAYFGGMLSSLSGRSLSCGMLNEVRPPEAFDPARHARLILWVKNPDGIPDARLESLIKELKLEKIAETDIAGVYKNRSADAKRSVAKDAVSCRSAFLILSVWAALVIFTLSLKGPPKAQLRR